MFFWCSGRAFLFFFRLLFHPLSFPALPSLTASQRGEKRLLSFCSHTTSPDRGCGEASKSAVLTDESFLIGVIIGVTLAIFLSGLLSIMKRFVGRGDT